MNKWPLVTYFTASMMSIAILSAKLGWLNNPHPKPFFNHQAEWIKTNKEVIYIPNDKRNRSLLLRGRNPK